MPAKIAIVGEAPGADEERLGKPFVGASGQELDRLLHEAGVLRSECFTTNVIKTRPRDNDIEEFVRRTKSAPASNWINIRGVWFHPEVAGDIELLQRELSQCRPTAIFGLGNLALWALSGRWGITDWRGSTLPAIGGATLIPTYHPAAVLRQWSWRSYVSRDLGRGVDVLRHGLKVPQYHFIINPQFDQVHATLHDLRRRLDLGPAQISCDIETRRGQIDCIGLAWSRVDALCIPFFSRLRSNYWSEDEEFSIVCALRSVLTHPNARVSGQNFSYDVQYIHRQWGFYPRLSFDTMLAHHTCWPGTDKDLATLSSLYCDYHSFWKHESQEADEREDDLGRWGYNCRDCVVTFEITEALCPLILSEGLADQCVFQHKMWWHTIETMRLGVRTNATARREVSKTLASEIQSREVWLREILGHELNIRSPVQLKALFYDDLRCPPIKIRTKKGPRISTNEEALLQICAKVPLLRPLVRRILEIRSLGVFKSTFVDSRLDIDGRIRCSYNVGGTETFRLSSSQNAFGSGMNLQNVPDGNKDWGLDEIELELPNIRKLFLFDGGMEGFDMDLSSADLRIVVAESGEEEIQKLLDAGKNPYLEFAKEFYQDDRIRKGDPKYTTFKSFAHGTNYLGTARGLAKRLGLAIAQAERTQSWYFQRFPRIREWQNRLKQEVASSRCVRNRFGNRRYFFDRIDDQLFNQAAAWVPQSTIGLLINRIWDRIRAEEPDIQILLQTHDSLTGQYPAQRAEYFRRRLRELSLIPIPYDTPLLIPTGLKVSTTSWGDCK